MTGLHRFRHLSLAVVVVTLALTSVGGLVRATGSGLGCLDEWPRCRGGWTAPDDYHGLIEYSHRAAAALVVLLIVASVIAARRWVRDDGRFTHLTLGSLAVVLLQAWLGRVVVTSGLHGAKVTLHFTTALALVALTTWTAYRAHAVAQAMRPASGKVSRLAVGAVVGMIPVLIVGAYVRERGAGLAFVDWPLMGGRLLPSLSSTVAVLQFAHRALALLLVLHLVGLVLRVRRDDRADVRLFAFAGVALFVAQIALGASNVWTRLHPAAVVGHVTIAYVTWAAFVALSCASRYEAATTTAEARPHFGGRLVAYLALTKPRIVVLLLVTTVPAMVLAQRGWPPLGLIAATLLGGMMTAGSANALNQYLERDIDEKMNRTRSRPLPSHRVPPRAALVFAVVLGAAGFIWLVLVVNLLSALLAASAILFYVLVYTLLLKRSTPQNIVIGGAAGAVPVLVGWAAVTGTIGAPAWVMFSIIFLWTPPHFWALAMRYRDDYAAAGVPMLPVVRGDRSTTLQILLYAIVLVAVTMFLSPIGGLGALYALTAAVLGCGFIYRAIRLRWSPDAASALKLFRYSISYLGLLFAAIAIDRLVW